MYIYYFIIYLLLPVFTYSCDLLVFIVCVIYFVRYIYGNKRIVHVQCLSCALFL